VAAPIGGGLIKMGQASSGVALTVGLAPYVLLAALYVLFVISYIPAAICFLCFAKNKQDAALDLITTSAEVIVALLTLTPPVRNPATSHRSKVPDQGRPVVPPADT
jgi:hypothetical protein